MKAYSRWSPTGHDTRGLGLEDRQDWLVGPVGTNRDADVLTRSNWAVVVKDIADADTCGDAHEVHRFGHWACGWFEIVLVRPGTACERVALGWEEALSDYPIACEEHFGETEREEADQVWSACYSVEQRINYIRKHRSQFEFRCMADMVGCVRGNYFAGDASEILS